MSWLTGTEGSLDALIGDPPDFGVPDDFGPVCPHGVDLGTGDCGGCEGPLPAHIRDAGYPNEGLDFDVGFDITAGDDNEDHFGDDEPGGYCVNAFGQRLRPGAPHFPGDRRVDEPTKRCRGCSVVLGASDPDVCEHCDLHEGEDSPL